MTIQDWGTLVTERGLSVALLMTACVWLANQLRLARKERIVIETSSAQTMNAVTQTMEKLTSNQVHELEKNRDWLEKIHSIVLEMKARTGG